MNTPELPYAGTSGWSGSATSRDRATQNDTDGTTQRTQDAALDLASRAGARGIIVTELRAAGFHHGQASGALSVLHKAGHLARLTERRDRCSIYVTTDNINNRETAPQGRNKPCPCEHCPGH